LAKIIVARAAPPHRISVMTKGKMMGIESSWY